jgi:hypothetical protein
MEVQTKSEAQAFRSEVNAPLPRGKLRSAVRSVEFSTIGELSAEYQKRL